MAERPVVLGIAGSPRRHGNSERLLEAALDGAREAGAETRAVIAAERGIEPCRGCNACSLTGECVVRDRMHDVYAELDAAGALVIASPVFFATVPAVLKALYDRCQPYWARVHVQGAAPRAKRPAALLLVRGGQDPYGFSSAIEPTRSVLSVVGFEVVSTLELEGVDSPSDVGRHADAIARARVIGASLAEAARRA